MKDLNKASTKKIALSVGQLIVILILLIFAGKFAFSKISEVRLNVSKARVEQTALVEKANLLSSVEGDISNFSEVTIAALPGANPALISISQLKSLAVSNAVIISNIKAGGEVKDKSGLMRVDVTFEIEGIRPSVLSFLNSVKTIAPISHVEKAKVNETSGVTRASLTVKSFWAELPTKLPSLTEKINGLTTEEETLLSQIAGLTQPSFVEVPPSTEIVTKPDPFSF